MTELPPTPLPAITVRDEDGLPRLTDDRIYEIANSMPGGMEGFTKGWGWQQFARAIESELTAQRAALGMEQDAARYRWLREWPERPTDYITTKLPWTVHIQVEYGVPTMTAIAQEPLDAAIDEAIRAAAELSKQHS